MRDENTRDDIAVIILVLGILIWILSSGCSYSRARAEKTGEDYKATLTVVNVGPGTQGNSAHIEVPGVGEMEQVSEQDQRESRGFFGGIGSALNSLFGGL